MAAEPNSDSPGECTDCDPTIDRTPVVIPADAIEHIEWTSMGFWADDGAWRTVPTRPDGWPLLEADAPAIVAAPGT